MKKTLFFAAVAAILALCSCAAIVGPGELSLNSERSAPDESAAASSNQSASAPSSSSAPLESGVSGAEISGAEISGAVTSGESPASRGESSGVPSPHASESPSSSEDAAPAYAIDIAPYLQSIGVSDLLLVNKQRLLPSDYVPDGLVDITYTRADRKKERMVSYAEKALRAFLEEAYSHGYTDVTVTSGYRSYATQEWLFNYYVEKEMKNGKPREQAEAAANTYSARPGTSEHQSGLCVDMHNLPGADQSFGNTDAGKWLAANAHRFGFILRFPKGKEEITGYSYEPWHFRFVGKEHAGRIYAEGLCLEEYLQKYFPERAGEQNK